MPRVERDAAIERLRKRHPDHGVGLLMVARACAKVARQFDSFAKLADWIDSASAAIEDLPLPRTTEVSLHWSEAQVGLGRTDVNQFVARAAEAQKAFTVLLTEGQRLRNALRLKGCSDFLELARDVELMAGAGALRYAADHKFRLAYGDFVDIGISLGLDRDDPGGRSLDSRWRKRRAALLKLAKRLPLKVPAPSEFHIDEEFFRPV